MSVRQRAAAAGLGVVLDRVLGEPPIRPHPVAIFGWVMQQLEKSMYLDDQAQGVAYLGAGVGVAAATGVLVHSTTVSTYLAVAGRSLADEARTIAGHLEARDVGAARDALPALVGRDPQGLGVDEMARAVVESVAENAVDALVAPALWGALAGGPGALCHRAINTLDSMVGYRGGRYEHFGWASARTDDVAAWVPARVTAGLVALVRPRLAGEVFRTVRRDAAAHPSPCAGVAEAAFAAALGLRLGGESRYGTRVEVRPPLGDGEAPAVADIERACCLLEDVGVALAGLLMAPLALHLVRRALR